MDLTELPIIAAPVAIVILSISAVTANLFYRDLIIITLTCACSLIPMLLTGAHIKAERERDWR
ncbi:MAG: hypothetical protein ACLQBD_01295 [Syntrophobacteraceae bacterium]